MYIKKCLAIGMLAGVLCSTSALGNQASTEYVKASIDTLRNELNNQFSSQFNELNNTANQLTIKTNELTTTTNQVMNTVNQLMIQLNALKTQTNESSTTINNKQGSRYLVIDFSHPWLKSTRQRAKLRAATVLRPLTFALNEQSVYLPQ